MPQQRFLTPDRLQDRSLATNQPFGRKPSAGRRWGMLLLFVFLCTLIGAYLFFTDSARVQRLAEAELSRLVGGTVTVGRAKLSIFEGLKLENVTVYIDQAATPQSVFFSADTFLVNYDLKSLLAGRLKLTQIIAIDPHVQLTENLDTERWNYQSMHRAPSSTSRPTSPSLSALPEIILRNAQIEYSGMRDGKTVSHGSMVIEGQFAPSADGERYSFELQSRGGSGGSTALGPTVTGILKRDTGEVTASLHDFQFGQDIRSMLPAQVRSWWDRHELAGWVDVPVLTYKPGPPGGQPTYRVDTVLRDVNLSVRPEEWMSREEIDVQQTAADAFDIMRGVGLNSSGVVDVLAGMVRPAPIQLEHVAGKFEFTENGILIGDHHGDGTVQGISGSLEKNQFDIDGKIDGYSPTSPASLRIAAAQIEIPADPRYLSSLPRQVQELYEHLRPQGRAALKVSVDRPTLGARLEVAGEVNILDGNFVFDKFPYPVRAATGKIVFGYDPQARMDDVRLVDLRGHGVMHGPNKNSIIKLDGLIGPLNSQAGVHVTVACDNVRNEPALTIAFPPEVKSALRNLDADGKGVYPKYRGSFECRINRAIGEHEPWIIDTDVTLIDAAGKMVAFPYLMEHVSGKLAIREGYVDIISATMKKNDASLTIDGRVTWRAGVEGSPLELGEVEGQVTPPRPDLKVIARNVPIDEALLDALPEDRRVWMRKAGLTGIIDIDGRVWRPAVAGRSRVEAQADDSQLTHAFDITLRNGAINPPGAKAAVSGLAAKMRLLPDGMIITDMSAHRGSSDISGRGEIRWPRNHPTVFFSGTAANLALDRSLYDILPATAQAGWDAVQPHGVVDVDLTYHGAVGVESPVESPGAAGIAAPLPPATQPSPQIDLIIHPRKLDATVRAVPYHLSDIDGTVRVTGSKVTLSDLSGKHGSTTVRITGNGDVGTHSDWELSLSAQNMPIDDDLRHALPATLDGLIDGLKLRGALTFDISRLRIHTLPPDQPVKPNAMAAPTPVDLDFNARFAVSGASFDVGVPVTHASGTMELSGTVRHNKLAALEGPIDFPELTIASRQASDLHAELYKPADQDGIRVGKINGKLAGGDIAGQVDLAFPADGRSLYAMSFVLRNADVRDLSADMQPDLSGELSASLALEGDWTDPRTRRGRGDVSVVGRQMYKIPLVLGLLQITNLSLPIQSPFNEGSARYSVNGQTVTFDSIELRSHDMLMSGSGQLDFGTKKVAMNFVTENPNLPNVPLIGDLVTTAKHELLQIRVKGTLQDNQSTTTPTTAPALPAGTSNTTVDEISHGDQPLPTKK